jgi:hypothetical protein
MEEDTTERETDPIAEFRLWIDGFLKEHHVPFYKFSDEADDILVMDYNELMSLTSEECYANALILMNYASLLQSRLDSIKSEFEWCSRLMNCLYREQWNNYDKFLTADVRKQSILSDNSYGQLLDEAYHKMKTGINLLENSCKDIKKRVSLLQDLGKSRSYNVR